MKRPRESRPVLRVVLFIGGFLLGPTVLRAQTPAASANHSAEGFQGETIQDYNKRLEQLRQSLAKSAGETEVSEYRIGANDLLEINIFEATELNRAARVSAGGQITMPLLGAVQAAGLTPRELENLLEMRLRKYMKDPHAGVFVSSVQSHPVSVVGAVKKPGVFQVQGPRTLLEMLSMAEGLADDAGDEVLVMRGAGLRYGTNPANEIAEPRSHRPPISGALTPAQNDSGKDDASNQKETIRVNMKNLLESGDPRYNLPIYPGDIIKVTRAGIVYVVGEVKKPGGFVLKSNEQMSVLKAIALAEGLTGTAAKSQTRIIHTDENTEKKTDIPIDLGKILSGKAPDPPLNASDIVFVPNSTGKAAFYRGTEAAIATASGIIIFHR